MPEENTPPTIQTTLPKQVTVMEEVGLTLKDLLFTIGTPSRPARVSLVLSAIDEHGEWRSDVEHKLIERTDTPAVPGHPLVPATEDTPEIPEVPEIPANPQASIIQSLTLNAIINHNLPEVQFLMSTYGIPIGTTVRDAAKYIIQQEI